MISPEQKKSADEAGDAVEALTLPVSTFHGIGFCKVHPLGNPAFRAVGKRRGFYKSAANPEFPAVDTEPAVLSRLLFRREALYFSLAYRQDAIIVIGHWQFPVLVVADILFYPSPYKTGESGRLQKALSLNHTGTKTVA
jgi:hypothetical protein